MVYLTDTALELIGDQIAIADNKKAREIPDDKKYVGFIFDSPASGWLKDDGTPRDPQPINERAMCRALLRSRTVPVTDDKGKPLFSSDGKPAVRNLLGVADFTPRDLRRTCATMLSELGFTGEIIDMILNHKKAGIRGTYNRNLYEKEKHAAAESWERKLQTIITGKSADNVVSITTAKGTRKAE